MTQYLKIAKHEHAIHHRKIHDITVQSLLIQIPNKKSDINSDLAQAIG